MTEKGYYDIHCHILPGVDDGAANIEEALQMIKIAYDDGIRHMVLTPHYQERIYETSATDLQREFHILQRKVMRRYKDMNLYLGAELFYHTDMVRKLEQNQLLTMAGTDYILIEFLPSMEKSTIIRGLRDILMAGKKPILAHVERYQHLAGDIDTIEQLIDMGVFMQVNASSVLGKSGWKTKHFVKKLLDYEMIHYIGTDAHGTKHRRPLLGECAAYIEKKWSRQYAEQLLIHNPARLLAEKKIL